MVFLFLTTYISVDLAHHEIFHAKVGTFVMVLVLSIHQVVRLYVEITHEL